MHPISRVTARGREREECRYRAEVVRVARVVGACDPLVDGRRAEECGTKDDGSQGL